MSSACSRGLTTRSRGTRGGVTFSRRSETAPPMRGATEEATGDLTVRSVAAVAASARRSATGSLVSAPHAATHRGHSMAIQQAVMSRSGAVVSATCFCRRMRSDTVPSRRSTDQHQKPARASADNISELFRGVLLGERAGSNTGGSHSGGLLTGASLRRVAVQAIAPLTPPGPRQAHQSEESRLTSSLKALPQPPRLRCKSLRSDHPSKSCRTASCRALSGLRCAVAL
jgi:hypothetical protein